MRKGERTRWLGKVSESTNVPNTHHPFPDSYKIPTALQPYLQGDTHVSHGVCNSKNQDFPSSTVPVLSWVNRCSWNQSGWGRFSPECLAASSCSALGASMGKHFDLWLLILSALSFLLMMETRQSSLDWRELVNSLDKHCHFVLSMHHCQQLIWEILCCNVS